MKGKGRRDEAYNASWRNIADAASISARARDFTHSLYRYPASMSPPLARALIQSFTSPGQTILDPFCGGGTTAIEALAHGRIALCSDLNPLACFLTRAKAFPVRPASLASLGGWISATERLLSRGPCNIASSNRTKNVNAPRTYDTLMFLRNRAVTIIEFRIIYLQRKQSRLLPESHHQGRALAHPLERATRMQAQLSEGARAEVG
jgi:hypothetical protein